MPNLGKDTAAGCVHSLFQKKQLFVEMVEAGAFCRFVGLGRLMKHGRNIRVMDQATSMPAVRKATRDTDGSDCIQPVGILDTLAFEGTHLSVYARTFIRDGRHNLNDRSNDVCRGSFPDEQALSFARAN